MGNCYLINHIAEDRIHTDITGNIEELQQKYALERSVIDNCGRKLKPVLPVTNPRP